MAQNSISRGWTGRFVAVFFLSMSILATWGMRLSNPALVASQGMERVINSHVFPDNNFPLREHYTGIQPLDTGLRVLVAAFLPGVAGWDKGCQMQQIYFLVSVFPIIAVWSAEAGRKRNAWALTSFTSIWALFYQSVGGAVVIPFYYLSYLRESAQKDYWSPESRHVQTGYAKALLPSLIIGYLLPTILMYLPFSDPDLSLTQILVALWQPSPLFVNLFLLTVSTALGNEPASSEKATFQPPNDIKYLNSLYIISFTVAAMAHFSTVFTCLSSAHPEISLTRTLVRVPLRERMAMPEALHFIFQVDFWIIFTVSLTAAYISLWDLKRMGKTDLSLINAATSMLVAVICVGPGATIAGVWYMREQMMIQKEKT